MPNLKITVGGRYTGKTTRLVDAAIQQFFTAGFLCVDASNCNGHADKIEDMIIRRLNHEHHMQYNTDFYVQERNSGFVIVMSDERLKMYFRSIQHHNHHLTPQTEATLRELEERAANFYNMYEHTIETINQVYKNSGMIALRPLEDTYKRRPKLEDEQKYKQLIRGVIPPFVVKKELERNLPDRKTAHKPIREIKVNYNLMLAIQGRMQIEDITGATLPIGTPVRMVNVIAVEHYFYDPFGTENRANRTKQRTHSVTILHKEFNRMIIGIEANMHYKDIPDLPILEEDNHAMAEAFAESFRNNRRSGFEGDITAFYHKWQEMRQRTIKSMHDEIKNL